MASAGRMIQRIVADVNTASANEPRRPPATPLSIVSNGNTASTTTTASNSAAAPARTAGQRAKSIRPSTTTIGSRAMSASMSVPSFRRFT
jgi:hypothetical protein